MLKAAEIRSCCYGSTYQRGKTYFDNDYVKQLETEWRESDKDHDEGYIHISGQVRGSGRKIYGVSVDVNGDEEIIDYFCECPAYNSYWGMCKHCVALALAYQDSQKKNRRSKALDLADLHRKTSEPLRQVMAQYGRRNRMNRFGGPDGEIDLECSFQSDYHGLLLSCRIGSKRKYVVKNLVKLVRDVEEIREVQYGANLKFVHDLSAFTPEAKEILTLLTRVISSRYTDYRNSYYEYSSNFRYFLLRHESIELFLDHFLGKTIRLNEKDIGVAEGIPPLVLTMKEVKGGAELSADPITVYAGLRHSYIQTENCVYRVSPDYAAAVLPIWELFQGDGRGRRAPVFLSQSDYGTFCGNVLPKLSSLVDIRTGSLNLEDYTPPEPEFSVYLSMPQDDRIEAAARVRYQDREYDLMAESVSDAYRNQEEEQILAGLLGKYFTAERILPEDYAGSGHEIQLEGEILPVRDLDEVFLAPADGGADAEQETVLFPRDGVRLAAVGEEAIYRLADEGLTELAGAADLYVDDSIRRLQIRPSPKVSVGIGISGNLLDFSVKVEGISREEIAEALAGYRRKKKYYRLKNGDFLNLSEESGLGTLSELASGLDLTGEDLAEGKTEIPLYRAPYLEGVLKDAEGAQVRKSQDYRRLVRGIRDYGDSDFEVPQEIHAELRRYQREGFRWLSTLYESGFGGILADDMGLGKTLQVIALIQSVANRRSPARFLIVVPASLVYNWESEVQRFAPALSVRVIAGLAAERKDQIAEAGEADVVVTSYDLLKRDVSEYRKQNWECMVIDEAQYIKNAGTQAAKAVKKVPAAHRFALTGTPIENRLSDLWSIFDFLMPGYLFSYKKFRDELESPIVKSGEEAAGRRLARMTTPFLLRRRKKDVLKDLPDKLEESVLVGMTAEQERLYLANAANLRLTLAGQDEKTFRENKLQILAELTKLRQLCCSPELCYENYKGGSGKVETCMELLRNAVEGGHRVLVFSQFTRMLELLRREWKKTGEKSLYLWGKNTKQERRAMVEEFQTGEIPVFFISLKAGGTGLNLTQADMVIHVDPWWNVAAQNQATDRAHRIGQTHVVTVMKLVARESIEEKILELQEKKAALADQIVEGEGVGDFTLNREDLMEIFSA